MEKGNKCDFVSGVLKGLLILTFLFIYGLLLFGSSVLTVQFALPNYLLFIIAVIILLLAARFIRFSTTMRMSRKKENICLVAISIFLLIIVFLL